MSIHEGREEMLALLPESRVLRASALTVLLVIMVFLPAGQVTMAASPPPSAVGVTNLIDDVFPGSGPSSLVLNQDGNPVIAYVDNVDDTLQSRLYKIAVCHDANCAAPPTINTLASGPFGDLLKVMLNSNGLPVVAYVDNGGDVVLQTCGDSTCTSTSMVGPIGLGDAEHRSVVLAADDRPIISYHNYSTNDLNLTVCNSADCDAPDTVIVDDVGVSGGNNTLALNSSGLPVMAYFDDGTNQAGLFTGLKVAVCNTSECTGPAISEVDTGYATGEFASMQFNQLGHPIISYYHLGAQSLMAAFCQDATCSFPPDVVTVDTNGVGRYTSMALSIGDYPVITGRTHLDLGLPRASWRVFITASRAPQSPFG